MYCDVVEKTNSEGFFKAVSKFKAIRIQLEETIQPLAQEADYKMKSRSSKGTESSSKLGCLSTDRQLTISAHHESHGKR